MESMLLRIILQYSILATLVTVLNGFQWHFPSANADDNMLEDGDELYPDVTNCFIGAAGRDDEFVELRRIDDFCSATNKNRTSVCFKLCIFDMWRLIGRDRITLNDDIEQNPQNYDEVSTSRLFRIDYRPVTGPVWALVAIQMLKIPFSEMKNKFQQEKEQMTKRIEKCTAFRFQSSLKDNHCGAIPHPIFSKEPEAAHSDKWEKLLDCIETALVRLSS
ncbi:unnamed protein product [Orchesella dallaii]|uniref:Uncharacterized protein n=1 Tax=Orchesella dallaii TaxID=48710 RepID=A0ABP1RUH3_9HEXA